MLFMIFTKRVKVVEIVDQRPMNVFILSDGSIIQEEFSLKVGDTLLIKGKVRQWKRINAAARPE